MNNNNKNKKKIYRVIINFERARVSVCRVNMCICVYVCVRVRKLKIGWLQWELEIDKAPPLHLPAFLLFCFVNRIRKWKIIGEKGESGVKRDRYDIAKGFEGMEQRIAPPTEMTFLTRTYGREKADLSCVTGYYYDKRRFFFFWSFPSSRNSFYYCIIYFLMKSYIFEHTQV